MTAKQTAHAPTFEALWPADLFTSMPVPSVFLLTPTTTKPCDLLQE